MLFAQPERNDAVYGAKHKKDKKKDLAATYSPAKLQYHRRESA